MITVEHLPENLVPFDGTQRTVYRFYQLGRPWYAANTDIGRVVTADEDINSFVNRIKKVGSSMAKGVRQG